MARSIHKALLTLCLLPLLVAQDYGSGTPMVMIPQVGAAVPTAQVFLGSNSQTASTTVNNYDSVIGAVALVWSTTIPLREDVVPVAGQISDFRARLNSTITSGLYTVSIMLNGSRSSITCPITALTCTFVGTLDLVAGDEVAFEVDPNTPNAARAVSWSFNFTPTTADEFILFSQSTSDTETTRFMPVSGVLNQGEATEEDATNVVCEAGTISDLHVEYENALAAGQQVTYTIQKDAAPIDGTFSDCGTVTCPVLASTSTCQDTSNSCSVAAGDRIVIERVIDSGSPVNQHVAMSVVFTPTTAGRFMVMGVTDTTPSNTVLQQKPLMSGDGAWQADTNSSAINFSNAWTVQNIYITTETGPDTHRIWEFRNDTDPATGPTCQTTGATDPANCNSTSTLSVDAGDIVNIRTDPNGVSPTATSGMSWCFGGTVP